jgi:alpha-N-arabinofuranosidase
MVSVLPAMILTDKEKLVLTPTYHLFKIYVAFQDAIFLPVSFDAGAYVHGDVTLPRLDAIAARDAAGKLWLAVTNLDREGPRRHTRSDARAQVGDGHFSRAVTRARSPCAHAECADRPGRPTLVLLDAGSEG